jgi:hypothetical protein
MIASGLLIAPLNRDSVFSGFIPKKYKPVGTRSYSTPRLRHHIRTVSATRFIPHRFTRPYLKLVASLAYNLPQTRMTGAG